MLNFKKQIKKEGPRTNLSSTPLLLVSYVRGVPVGPYSKGEVGAHGEVE